MSENFWMFIIGQSVVIVGALVGIYVGLSTKLARIETNEGNTARRVTEHRQDHKGLNSQVQGISRRVERHDGAIAALQNDNNHH